MSESNPFLSSGSSSAGSGATGDARTVDAGQGWAWIVNGFELFKKQPGNWVVIAIILIVIMMVLAFIPFLGAIATYLLMPVFTGGLMLGCRSLARSGTLEINHLFAGFQTRTGELVTLGAIGIAAGIVMMLPVLAITFFGAFFGASAGGAAGMGGMGVSFLLALLIVLALSILLSMALWFAPALVALGGVAPIAAIKQSFAACLKNFIPFLVYGLVVMVLGIVAMIPLGLGWLVLIPVLAASVYTAYQDIFGDA